MTKPKVSIVIPAHNEEKLIVDCLSSIIAHTARDVVEIIVVDNASVDGTRDVVKSFPSVILIEESNKGVMHARQRGYEKSSGDIVVFVDADNVVFPEWMDRIMWQFENNPNMVCLTGPYDYYDLSYLKRQLALLHWHIIIYAAYIIVGYIGNFGNMAIRRNTLQKMGGLDTSIMFYGDDTATARHASEFGKVKYDRKLKVHSSGRRFEKQGIFKTAAIYAANFLSQVLTKKSVTKNSLEYR